MKKLVIILFYWLIMDTAFAQINITGAEYFFNTDPGFGNGISIPITPGADINDINFSASVTPLPQGINNLFVRTRDANGKWSITNHFIFARVSTRANASNINRVEYFFDTDPGFGNGTNIPISPALDIDNSVLVINLNALTGGLHNLYIRSRDTDGKWSITSHFLFLRHIVTNINNDVVVAEYFIDSDPGFGKGIPIAFNQVDDLIDKALFVNITSLATGNHRLFIRSRDNNKRWSITNTISFPVGTPVAAPAIVVNSITETFRCGDESLDIAYHITGSYTAGNIFSAQLSDAAGSFANPLVIGSITGTGNNIIHCTLPIKIPNGTQYKVRVVSSNPVVNGLASDIELTPLPQPSYNDTAVYVSCLNETYNLTTIYNTTGFTTLWDAPNPSAASIDTFRLITSNSTCRDTAFTIVQQDIALWKGTIDNDWHKAGNWSTQRVPSNTTNVIIASGNPIISTADGEAASVQIRSGASLQLQNDRQLSITKRCNPLPAGL